MNFRQRIFIVWVVLLTALFFDGGRPSEARQGNSAEAIVAEVNAFRARMGLPPFTYNASLAAAAQQQASYMAANNIYSHTGAGGSTPYTRATSFGYPAAGYASENIVGGWKMTPPQGVLWWENSPVHYNTITSQRYTEIGGGFAQGFDQNFYAIVVGVPPSSPSAVPVASNKVDTSPAPIKAPPFHRAAPAADGSIVHVVAEGQALWTLSAYYGVEINYLMRINNLGENDFLHEGDAVLVQLAEGQATPTPLPTPTPQLTYVVQKGDTLLSIAIAQSVSLDDMLLLNSLDENTLLSVGDVLTVHLAPGQAPPPPPPTATPQLTHVVATGDSAWSIAARFGLSLDELMALNGLSEGALLSVGQVLQIVAVTPTVVVSAEPTLTPTVETTPAPIAPAPVAGTVAPSPPPILPTPSAAAVTLPTPTEALPVPPVEKSGDAIPPTTAILAGVLAIVVAGGLLWMGRRSA